MPADRLLTTGNPAILYDDVEGANGVWSATDKSQECLQDDIFAGNPMDAFDQALATGAVPDFNLILPNGCEDGEGNCQPINNRYTQFDGHVVCAILSPLAVPGAYGGTFYHYSLLRTIEDGLGLSGHVGYANDVTAINTIWGTRSSWGRLGARRPRAG